MPRNEHNGEGFHYLITYRRNVSGAEEVKHRENDWRREELVVDGQETFRAYEISVQAVNKEGHAPIDNSEKRIGFSGQDGERLFIFFQTSVAPHFLTPPSMVLS